MDKKATFLGEWKGVAHFLGVPEGNSWGSQVSCSQGYKSPAPLVTPLVKAQKFEKNLLALRQDSRFMVNPCSCHLGLFTDVRAQLFLAVWLVWQVKYKRREHMAIPGKSLKSQPQFPTCLFPPAWERKSLLRQGFHQPRSPRSHNEQSTPTALTNVWGCSVSRIHWVCKCGSCLSQQHEPACLTESAVVICIWLRRSEWEDRRWGRGWPAVKRGACHPPRYYPFSGCRGREKSRSAVSSQLLGES